MPPATAAEFAAAPGSGARSDPYAARLDRTLAMLMRAFARVLEDLGEDAVAARLPWPELWREGGAAPDAALEPPAERLAQAASIAFQLLSQAEENATAQTRRAADAAGALAEDPGSWDQHFARLKARGFDGADVAEALAGVRVEPVLTAHPTEAKRQSVLHHHRALYRLIVEAENAMWSPSEREALESEMRAVIEKLWRTGEIFLEKPTVAHERANALHYLARVFPEALDWVDRGLAAAWRRADFDPALLGAARPRVSFGGWVGGDRDGHPFVDVATTVETLRLLRAEALGLQRRALSGLGAALSLSAFRQPTPAALTDWIAARAEALGEAGATALARNPDEPWRQAVNLMAAALRPEAGPAPEAAYRSGAELAADLRRLGEALEAVGARRLAREDVGPILRRAESFGFHLAALDVRQNSAFHDRALAGLLALAGEPDGAGFAGWPPERRAALIRRELAAERPFASPGRDAGPEAADAVGALRALDAHVEAHGAEGVGALIVSMTRSAEDILAVALLAREAGFLRRDAEGPWLPAPVVPLLETIDDLKNGPAIVEALLDEPLIRRSLDRQAAAAGRDEPVQQVMVGYSDSGKDGGFVASVWTLYRAQRAIAEAGARRGVRIRFFHGRGGTIGRGAGPTHRFLRALPPDALNGDLRLTEQGEAVSSKYANRVTAAHQLELLAAGALGATLDRREDPPELLAAMDRLAEIARAAYGDLVGAEGFIEFFGQATPIDAIEQNRIGSRPARRTGRRTLADLRAIPWVFAWSQSRFGLPGWFGLGAALEALRAEDPEAFEALRRAKAEESRWPPAHYLFSNAATAWAAASPRIMAGYAGLVEDAALRDRIFGVIAAEHARTGDTLAAIYGGPLAERRPRAQAAIARRDAGLAPLHARQIDLLRRWRALRETGGEAEAAEALSGVLLTVNAVAAGLGATG